MQENDKERFAKVMTILAETFNMPITMPTIEIYFEILKPATIRQVEWALKKILMDWSYHVIPPPAEFIKWLNPFRMKSLGEYYYPDYMRQELRALGDPIPKFRVGTEYARPYEDVNEARKELEMNNANRIAHRPIMDGAEKGENNGT